jgi:hypothetical protein
MIANCIIILASNYFLHDELYLTYGNVQNVGKLVDGVGWPRIESAKKPIEYKLGKFVIESMSDIHLTKGTAGLLSRSTSLRHTEDS